MDEQRYLHLADDTFRKILDVFEDVDVDDADVESTGDVITVTYGNGARVVINTQRPARQIWLAGGDRAWHFSYDEAGGRWLDDKGSGAELFQTLAEISRSQANIELRLP